MQRSRGEGALQHKKVPKICLGVFGDLQVFAKHKSGRALIHTQSSWVKSKSYILAKYKGGVICVSEVIDISPGNLDSSLCLIWPSISHDVLCM